MSRNRWIALIIAIVLLFISVGSQAISSALSTDFDEMMNFNGNQFAEEVIEEGSAMNKIAVIRLNGVIQDTSTNAFNTTVYNHNRFLKMIEEAGENSTVSGIILRVNTPGGGVVESAEIHDKIKEIQEEYGKPVYVSMGNTAASGGYYISAPADKIVAHPATLTGSIGVIMESINFAELAEQLGIDFNTIKSGEFKDIMSASREMTEDERDILQTMIDELYGDFVQVIVEGREMSDQRVRELGDGRVYTGSQAHELGLVDELGTLDDTIDMIKEELNLESAQVIEYKNGLEIYQFIGLNLKNAFSSDSELDGIVNLLRQSNAPRAMYLYSE
ncbi:signal peptide peptidase SppA [Oceanobacillus halophilus]|uniref:Signal peptide peptidase SppA n=1 Tax=Oceanobacillus halophilus TaxID=930130 RepID=A0A495A1Z0_9BACI|nr:signal peptide peptidase SppA [Oceanobacillus halophilus]RKQ32949.1 signal peptide peptidase SppA [Oceanobacillus halophilus]